MRIIPCLMRKFNKVGELTKRFANLPESYIERTVYPVYAETPKAPQYLRKVNRKKKVHFGTDRPWSPPALQYNQTHRHTRKIFVEPVGEWSFFKGDRVEVQVGKDKGKQGIISQVIQERNWVIVEGLNTKLKRIGEEKNFPGVMIREEKPLLVTDEIKLVDPESLLATDFEWRFTEEGEKVRVSSTTSRIIPIPTQAYETKDYKTKATYLENKEKDTESSTISEVTYKPSLRTFEMEIMDEMGIKEDREAAKSYWY